MEFQLPGFNAFINELILLISFMYKTTNVIICACLLVVCVPAMAQYHAEPTQAGNNYKCYQWNKPRNWGSMKPIDYERLSVTYDYTFCATADSTGAKLNDTYRLQIGEKVNRFFSEYSQRIDSIAFNYLMSLEQRHLDALTPDWTPSRLSRTLYSWIPDEVCPLYYDVYTFDDSRERIVSSRFQYIEYQYTEPADVLDWEMMPGSRSILGFECNCARTSYRGRTWTVWFTFDMPISSGPWKLGGLPGLILEAEDNLGLFKWTAVGIAQEEKVPICEFVAGYSTDKRIYVWIPDNKVKKCTRKEMESLWRRFWNAPLTIRVLEQQEGYFTDSEEKDYMVRVSDPVPNNYYPKLELDI